MKTDAMDNLGGSSSNSMSQLELFKKHLAEQHRMTAADINAFLEAELSIPVTCFNDKLSILESVVKFLKEEQEYNYHKIGELLERDERNVWTTYNNSQKKMKSKLDVSSQIRIPISRFKGTAGLYAVVAYLKENNDYNYKKIGDLLKRNERTIWTTYNKERKSKKNKK